MKGTKMLGNQSPMGMGFPRHEIGNSPLLNGYGRARRRSKIPVHRFGPPPVQKREVAPVPVIRILEPQRQRQYQVRGMLALSMAYAS